jgi:hypothetical protein
MAGCEFRIRIKLASAINQTAQIARISAKVDTHQGIVLL